MLCDVEASVARVLCAEDIKDVVPLPVVVLEVLVLVAARVGTVWTGVMMVVPSL